MYLSLLICTSVNETKPMRFFLITFLKRNLVNGNPTTLATFFFFFKDRVLGFVVVGGGGVGVFVLFFLVYLWLSRN